MMVQESEEQEGEIRTVQISVLKGVLLRSGIKAVSRILGYIPLSNNFREVVYGVREVESALVEEVVERAAVGVVEESA